MAENVTADPSLSYRTSGDGDDGENIDLYYCPSLPDGWIVFTLVCVGICLCGLVGNGTVMWFLGCKMKQNPFTVYVLNLAAADFSLLVFLLFRFTVTILIGVHCVFSYRLLLADDIMTILFQFWYFASMYLLTAINVERCLSVLFPLWYRCRCPKHLSGIVCGVIWALAGICGSLALIGCRYADKCKNILKSLSILNILIFFSFPLLSDLFLFLKLRWGSRRRHPGRFYVAILLSVLFMLILGLPFSVELLLETFFFPMFYFDIFSFLTSLNSSLNPVIYVLVGSCRKHHLQCSVTGALRRLFEEKPMPEERSSMPEDDEVVETSL